MPTRVDATIHKTAGVIQEIADLQDNLVPADVLEHCLFNLCIPVAKKYAGFLCMQHFTHVDIALETGLTHKSDGVSIKTIFCSTDRNTGVFHSCAEMPPPEKRTYSEAIFFLAGNDLHTFTKIDDGANKLIFHDWNWMHYRVSHVGKAVFALTNPDHRCF